MKLIYRILTLFAIFVASLIFFGQDIEEKIFFERDTVVMSESTLPSVSLTVKDKEINLLCGYTTKLDPVSVREYITPVDTDKSLDVMIYENESVVRKLTYELYDINTEELLEEGAVSALTTVGDCKVANLILTYSMTEGKEYALRLTLITDTSKRVYYYTRLKLYNGSKIAEAVDYARWFHDSLLSRENEAEIKERLESSSKAANDNYAEVNIESSYDMVCYGDLNPQVVYELPLAITEAYTYINTFVFKYVVSVDTGNGNEYYLVKECIRTRYTGNEKNLFAVLNYERSMQAIFDVRNTSLAKNQFKLGITDAPEAERLVSSSKAYTALRIGNELFLYTKKDNTLTRVFSFREEEPNYLQELNDNHDIKILDISEEGDIDFAVYGYMNRGAYEGRVCMILYTYHNENDRVEERAYFPLDISYQILKEELADFMWLNRYEIFYFSFYDSIYAYNMSTEELEIVEEGFDKDRLIVKQSLKKVAWQNKEDLSRFVIFDPETDTKKYIEAEDGERIILFDTIDDNLIYGYVKEEDIVENNDGTVLYPVYRLLISDFEQNILKIYEKSGYYVTEIEVDDNVVVLGRVRKVSSFVNGYETTEDDAIQTKKTASSAGIISSRLTEKMLKEYYVSMPSGVSFDGIPEIKTTEFETVEKDTTIRIDKAYEDIERYYTYVYGEVIGSFMKASEAVAAADSSKKAGTVISASGRIIWERINLADRTELSIASLTKAEGGKTALQASMQTFFMFLGNDVDGLQLDFTNNSINEYIESNMKAEAVSLKGIDFESVIYYIYKKRPVIAVTGNNEAYLICGYVRETVIENQTAVTKVTELTVADAYTGQKRVMTRDEAAELFDGNGYSFVCYAE